MTTTRRVILKSLLFAVAVAIAFSACSPGRKVAKPLVSGIHSAEYQYFYLEALRQYNAGH